MQWIEEPPARHMVFVDLPEPVGRVAAVSFPQAEVATIPRHVHAREVRTFVSVPRIAARVLSASAPALVALARSPLAGVLLRLGGDQRDGPDEATRRRDAFHIAVDVRGRRQGRAAQRRMILRGRDVYGLTAAIARQGALLMLAGRVTRSGVLAPAMAFDPRRFLDGLRPERLVYEVVSD